MALPDAAGNALQNAMKMARVAIQLDTESRQKEAYCEYLKSIHFITQALIEDAQIKDEKELITPEVQKMLKLADQCLERIKTTAGKLGEVESQPAAGHIAEPSYTPSHRRVVSDGGGAGTSLLPPEVFQKLQIPETQITKRELTPLEEASRQNQKLKAAYEARMARLNPNQGMQKTSLTLSLQRQMMENLIIGQARQAALQRKMEERRLRLQEEANRRFSNSAVLTPEEEEEQRNVYTSILEFEQDHEWPKQWKMRLSSQPNDLALVAGLVSQILSCTEYPITQLLKKVQWRIYTKLYPMVKSQFSDVSDIPEQCPGTALYTSPDQCPLKMDVTSSFNKGSKLTSSKSACCLGYVPDQNKIGGGPLRHSSSISSMACTERYKEITDISNHGGLGQNSAAQQINPAVNDRTDLMVDKNSPFEDLEHYVMKFNPQLGNIINCPTLMTNIEQHQVEDTPLQNHLKDIVTDVHNSIDKLLSLCILAFEPLDTATGKDQCLASIEEALFQPIWVFLLALFRKVNTQREIALDKSMKLYTSVGPEDFGITDKFFPKESASSNASYPYEAAVKELRLITKEYCPQKKLECIVRTLHLICESAEYYCNSKEAGSIHVASPMLEPKPIYSYLNFTSSQPESCTKTSTKTWLPIVIEDSPSTNGILCPIWNASMFCLFH
ncbi:VPS9 domain-containing protein 1 isoform X2 [Narcine bancroftii]|uniref:VPS9 domain-containing protein 1 isoform X2 n=1 Tax=Narcine bancroftii TaxID=1343680 RepID=UPI003832155B